MRELMRELEQQIVTTDPRPSKTVIIDWYTHRHWYTHDKDLRFQNHVCILCKSVGRKISMMARIAMSISKAKKVKTGIKFSSFIGFDL